MKRAQIQILMVVAVIALLAAGGLAWYVFGQENGPAAELQVLSTATLPSDVFASPEPNPTAQSAQPARTDLPDVIPLPSPSPSPAVLDPLACLPATSGETGQVVETLPGGVLRVDLGGVVHAVKLLGADPAGSGGQALGLLRELAEGKTVRLLRDGADMDAAGNLLRYVVAEMLSSTMSWCAAGRPCPLFTRPVRPAARRCWPLKNRPGRKAWDTGP